MCCLLSAASGEPDSLVQSIVNSVTQESIRTTILRLQKFGTRYADTDSNYAAVLYARDRMVGYSCDSVKLDYFDSSYYQPSVIGIKRGKLYPDISYIICGHIDDMIDMVCSPVSDSAPGADDNATGTSAVLEACRVFAGHWFNYTVRFVCFNAEEEGTVGSLAYAYWARARGDSILGVLNLDMVGYGIGGQDSVITVGSESNPNCSDLLQHWCSAANTYTPLKFRPFLCPPDSYSGSDHYQFWLKGYRALFVEEAQRTPEMHSPGDTIGPFGYDSCGVNNLPLCTEATKGAVATLALLAQVDGVPGVQETTNNVRRTSARCPSVVRGVLLLPNATSRKPQAAGLLDISGRKVLDLKPGANDVRALTPGVYFVREQPQASSCKPQAVRKIVVTR